MGIRDRTRAAVRADIADRALCMFDEHGFEATTVDDIAREAGISVRTFFRYFATKEDVVFGDLLPIGDSVCAALADRPPSEAAWPALHAAIRVIADIAEAEPDTALRSTRVASSTPSLRARGHQKHTVWAGLLAPLIESRIDGHPEGHMAAAALIYCALACLDVALNEWAESGGTRDLGHLIDIAFDTVQRPPMPGR